MANITTHGMRTNAVWRRFKALGTDLLKTMLGVQDLIGKAPEAVTSAVLHDAQRYLQGAGADGPRKLARKYANGEARARASALSRKGGKARRKPQCYEYRDIHQTMGTNLVVRLAVLSALLEGTWGPMCVEVEKRLDKAEASDFWNQEAAEDRCDTWRDRQAAMEADTESVETIVNLLTELGQGKELDLVQDLDGALDGCEDFALFNYLGY